MNIETLELALDALNAVGALIEHQYTGTSAGMNALQIACDDCHDAAEALRKEIGARVPDNAESNGAQHPTRTPG